MTFFDNMFSMTKVLRVAILGSGYKKEKYLGQVEPYSQSQGLLIQY